MSYSPLSQPLPTQQPTTHSVASSSTSPQPPSGIHLPQIHKRTYQACIPCRQRKVRCDLGSVEAPHSPPCVRCRRESKDCFFSATRRKTRTGPNTIGRGGSRVTGTLGRGGGYVGTPSVTKREYGEDGGIYDVGEDGGGDTDSISTSSLISQRAIRKKQKLDGDSSKISSYSHPPTIIEPELRYRSTTQPPHDVHQNQQAASASRERLLQGEVYNSHDALHLLYEAAGRGASAPPSPAKPKSDNGDNDDEDGADDDGDEDEDNDNDHPMEDAPKDSGAVRSLSTARTDIGSYPSKYDDADGRSSINPIGHYNGVTTSTSYLRGTGRPTSKPVPPKECIHPTNSTSRTASSNAQPTSPLSTRSNHFQPSSQSSATRHRPSLSQRSVGTDKSSCVTEDQGLQAALKAWGKSRFVKSGWFTAREAIGYIDYFFEHHHPLSPLLTTSYAQHSTHPALLQHEPFLATTLLAIASRYVNLPGPGGHSRSYAIHDMLWRELRRGLESVIWGGGGGGPPNRGGVGGVGSSQGKGLRTLGTVEALMVLTEWHVRNLHFPVGGEGGWGAFDGVFGNDPDEEENDGNTNLGEGASHRRKGGIAGRRARERHRGVVEGLGDRIENILEPAWRSDRMSWMLLGNALTLSYELGVFDDLDEPISSVSTPQSVATPSSATYPPSNAQGQPAAPIVSPATTYRMRCRRIQKLLVVYVTQLASRLGWTSMIPKNITDALGYKGQYTETHSHLVAAAGAVGEAFPYSISKQDTAGASRPGTADVPAGSTNGPASANASNTGGGAAVASTPPKADGIAVNGAGVSIINRTPTELQDAVFEVWVDLTMLMKYCGERCFPSRVGTRDLMRSGKYVSLLETLRPILRGWKEGFEAFGFPTPIHNILTLEYEHVRMYINSLALQAIIDRCTTASLQPPLNSNIKQCSTSSEQPSFAALMQTYSGDLAFITEVVDAARCVLTTVVERMASTGELKHAPVRIYLRILSAAMFLLKTFALGAKEDDITVSLELMDQTVEVLRRESVDDVHLGLRFGELLETLTKRVKMRFVRMAGSRADSPAPQVFESKAKAVATGEVDAERIVYTNGTTVNGGNATTDVRQDEKPTEQNKDGGANISINTSGNNNFTPSTLMPPPPSRGAGVTGGSVFFPPGFEDWLALPIDPIMGWSGGGDHTFGGLSGVGGVNGASNITGGGSSGGRGSGSGGYGGASSVTQTQMGPDVGGFDLLELLLSEGSGGGGEL
ncbi:hypothetical protein BDZ91DRAFT_739034 [Kalaharituber pfeilii]|nr:hypothetical protein BDZ91DRAFT_739034 [Kalaharituber pfeilii]